MKEKAIEKINNECGGNVGQGRRDRDRRCGAA